MKVLINTREVINTPANIINGAQAARLLSCKKDLGFTTSRSLLVSACNHKDKFQQSRTDFG